MRYYFHIDYGEYSPDMEGTELPTPESARSAAVDLLGGLLKERGDAFWTKPDIVVTVTDDVGLTLWTLQAVGTAAPATYGSKPNVQR